MPLEGCSQAMEILNLVFQSGLILNDGHEILARLSAGDDPGDIVAGLGHKFSRFKRAGPAEVRRVVRAWPQLHMEAVSTLLQWALAKLDTDDRVHISWKGDAHHPETVTRFELRGNNLLIEFAHPPGAV